MHKSRVNHLELVLNHLIYCFQVKWSLSRRNGMDSSRKAKEIQAFNPYTPSYTPYGRGVWIQKGAGQVHTPHMDEMTQLQEDTNLATPLHTPRMEGAYGSAAQFV